MKSKSRMESVLTSYFTRKTRLKYNCQENCSQRSPGKVRDHIFFMEGEEEKYALFFHLGKHDSFFPFALLIIYNYTYIL